MIEADTGLSFNLRGDCPHCGADVKYFKHEIDARGMGCSSKCSNTDCPRYITFGLNPDFEFGHQISEYVFRRKQAKTRE